MREIGIQYSAPMVRAVLDGSKTVTRRTVKGEIPAGAVRAVFEPVRVGGKPAWRWLDDKGGPLGKPFRCPYGVAGDRLWVREAWRVSDKFDKKAPREIAPRCCTVFYEAGGSSSNDGEPPTWQSGEWPSRPGPIPSWVGKFRPGMFMPHWASRIGLEVTGVACERLQDITGMQAIAEGLLSVESCAFPGTRSWADYHLLHDPFEWFRSPVDSYRSLWTSLNGPDSWSENPWVFAISFRRITP